MSMRGTCAAPSNRGVHDTAHHYRRPIPDAGNGWFLRVTTGRNRPEAVIRALYETNYRRQRNEYASVTMAEKLPASLS